MEQSDKISKKTLCVGFLSNADTSILKLKSISGFRTQSMEEQEGLRFLAFAESIPVEVVWEKVRAADPILNLKEKKFFYVAKTFDVLPATVRDLSSEPKPDYTSMLVALIKLGLELRLMRLFKEGDIRVLNAYAFSVDTSRKVKRVLHSFQTNQLTSRVPYSLTDEEILELREFLKTVHLPFPQGFLALAFSLFESSYGVREPALAFLTLMISMEVMFNVSHETIVSREVSALCSALLAGDEGNRKRIAAEIQTMYRKRSKIVHYGQIGLVKEKDVLDLRQHIRGSIMEIIKKGFERPQLVASSGLNSKSRTFAEKSSN